MDELLRKVSHSSDGSGGESDFLKQAKGFLHSHGSGSHAPAPGATSGTPAAPAQQGGAPVAGVASEKTNYKQVYGSAQTLYQGLQDKLSGKPSSIDNHQLAEAAADVLHAANKAGFAKDNQYGNYFEKAETYLHHYGAPKGTAGAAPVAPPVAAPGAAPGAPSTGAYPPAYPPPPRQ